MMSRWMNDLLYVFVMFAQKETPSCMTEIQRWLEKHLKFFCLRTRKTWRAQRNKVEAAMGGKTRMSHVLNLIVCLQSRFWSYGSVDNLLSACPHSTTTSFLPFRKSDAMSTESLNTQRSRPLIPAAFRRSISILLQPKLFRFPVKKLKVHGFTEGFQQILEKQTTGQKHDSDTLVKLHLLCELAVRLNVIHLWSLTCRHAVRFNYDW